jgi:hypothetical protein
MSALMRHILEHKRQRRRKLAALPFPEKVQIVEQMRDTVTRIRTPAARGGDRTPVPPASRVEPAK